VVDSLTITAVNTKTQNIANLFMFTMKINQ
jgi:archaellum biogenesis ATPase FlaH